MSKTALNSLTVSMRKELKFYEIPITVNAIHPGWIPTHMSGFAGPDDMDTRISKMVDTILKFMPSDTARYKNVNGDMKF